MSRAERGLERLAGAGRERLGHHQPDRRHGAAAGQLERRPAGDQPAVVDDVDLVGEPLRLVHVVRGQHHGHAVVAQLLEQLPDGAAHGRVEPGGRLVDEDDLGPPDQGHRQPEPLLLAAREPAVRRPAALGEAEPLLEQRRVQRVRVQGGDVAQHLRRADPAPGAAVLQHHADPGEQLAGLAPRVEPEDPDRARLRAR